MSRHFSSGACSAGLSSCKLTPFKRRLRYVLEQIPRGKVASFATIAQALGTHPRPVGTQVYKLMNAENGHFAHRAVPSSRRISGGVLCTQRVRLKGEGVEFDVNGRILEHCFVTSLEPPPGLESRRRRRQVQANK
mmetsp:Transcript_10872/g.17813  ORF Transcript_10872/g.17813 Transcript_10872/m.17813 type:complete len:135 (+) Transcript_10872:253-657(+)